MSKDLHEPKSPLDKPVFRAFPNFTWEHLIVSLIVLIAVISRIYHLGNRVMAHDEVNHVVPAYTLSTGGGYAHDPITHGPFQFHLLALSYFILGDSDFAARVPAALFSIAAVFVVLFAYRRYLGRVGALIGGLLMTISPLILYYGRYTRNEAFIELFAVVTLYAMLHYFEEKDEKSLLILAAVTALQFTTKEVAYIYTAQLLIFCGLIFLNNVWNLNWKRETDRYRAFGTLVMAGFFALLGLALPRLFTNGDETNPTLKIVSLGFMAVGAIILILVITLTVRRFTWKTFRRMASFNLIVYMMALILPLLTALPVSLMGLDPIDYSSGNILKTGIVLAILFVLSFLLGMWWNRRTFLKGAVIFWLIFIVFYTTLFSNGQGFFTGIVGSLGYWLAQHDVQRGGQPLYYYAAVILPIYEFAAIFGTVLAIVFASRRGSYLTFPYKNRLSDPMTDDEVDVGADNDESVLNDEIVVEWRDEAGAELSALKIENVPVSGDDFDELIDELADKEADNGNLDITPDFTVNTTDDYTADSPDNNALDDTLITFYEPMPVLPLFLFWGFSALIAYSIAGEKMPWLGVHIALPLALSAAWGYGFLAEIADWRSYFSVKGIAVAALTVTGLYALGGALAPFSGGIRPFAATDLNGLKATSLFVSALIVLILVIVILFKLLRKQNGDKIAMGYIVALSLILIGLQTRTAYQSSFINDEYANEYLVYAHSSPAPKVILREIEEIAARTGEGKAIRVAYDNDARYPYWWYFRDYTNKLDFNDAPTRDLRNYDIILANSSKISKLEPIVGDAYYRYDYIRLWWPNQDYFRVSGDGLLNAIVNPAMRQAILDIWLNRDFARYAKLTGSTTMTAETWEPSARMVVYMKKDLMRKMWKIGDSELLATTDETSVFPDEKFVPLNPVQSFGEGGLEAGLLNKPRNLAIASNGDVYVLNSDNQRVDVFDASGQYRFDFTNPDHGGFNQPWGIEIDSKDNVYIADTWNHRMLKFDAQGNFLLEWYANDPTSQSLSFYGPRAIAINTRDRIYVTDTGNKRILIYDTDGQYLGKFGEVGMGAGEFDEPVGVAVYKSQFLAVADTWNQRVQVFDISGETVDPMPIVTFPVNAWYSQSLDNKPYLTFDSTGETILFSDPESGLIWQYTMSGSLIRSFNAAGGGIDTIAMPTGLTVADDGSLWVVDTLANKVNRFILPPLSESENADREAPENNEGISEENSESIDNVNDEKEPVVIDVPPIDKDAKP